MEENIEQQKKSLPLMTAVGVIILVAVAVWMLWIGNEKSTTKSESTKMQPSVKPTESVNQTTEKKQADQPIIVEGGSFYFKPDTIKVKKGQKVTIAFTNAGGIHDFVIDEFNIRTERIKSGETQTVSFTPDRTGSFEYYCSIGEHREMGMKGTLVVE